VGRFWLGKDWGVAGLPLKFTTGSVVYWVPLPQPKTARRRLGSHACVGYFHSSFVVLFCVSLTFVRDC